jgi:hypothetical protein
LLEKHTQELAPGFLIYIGDTNIEANLMFAIFLGIPAFGFTGISDTLAGVNRAFYIVINSAFAYQFKRSILFLAVFFVPMIIVSAAVNANYLFIYLYAIVLLMIFL